MDGLEKTSLLRLLLQHRWSFHSGQKTATEMEQQTPELLCTHVCTNCGHIHDNAKTLAELYRHIKGQEEYAELQQQL